MTYRTGGAVVQGTGRRYVVISVGNIPEETAQELVAAVSQDLDEKVRRSRRNVDEIGVPEKESVIR